MKRTFKWLIGGLVTVFVLLGLYIGIYLVRAKSEMKKLVPVETKEVVNNIFSIKDTFVNLYLIKDSTQYIAIDAGNDLNAVSGELKKLNIDPEKIIALFLTHTDGDHVAAIKLFKNAKVYLSRPEEQLLNGKKWRFLFFGNKIDTKVYSLIDDQQIITIGNTKIKGILTPGHTPGSMCFLVNDKYLFTGDALSLKNGKIDRFNELFNVDSKMGFESMAKITGIQGVEYIFTAHHGYTDDYKSAVKGFTSLQK
jgi:glyoxylase-like metal-dependent hydrolase (beta-lactamase superfamily II)